MTDINKIRILHDLNENFDIPKEDLDKLLSKSIKDEKIKLRINAFFDSYKIEDIFFNFFSALPWVKLIHKLGEEQLPKQSKTIYQVPDFLIFFENITISDVPILVDVKSIKESSHTLKNIMSKQVDIIHNYSKIMGIPYLYAIYWKKINVWTINTIEHFDKKSKTYKLSIGSALENDLSIIFGDLTYFLFNNIHRKCYYDLKFKDENHILHNKYGGLYKEELSLDGNKYFEINEIESAIINSILIFKETSVIKNNDITEVIDFSSELAASKLSTLMLRTISLFEVDLKHNNAMASVYNILNLFNKIGLKPIYMFPKIRTNISDSLIEKAFHGSDIIQKYYSM